MRSVSSKKTILGIIVTSCLMAACSIKEPPVLGKSCPSGSDGDISYVLEAGNKILPGDGVWEDAFDYRRCPEGFSCGVDSDHHYYCYTKCEPEGIRCEGNSCLVVNEAGIVTDSNDYCGAKGLCNSSEADSDNYKGVKCESPQKCIRGVCKCEDDNCDCGTEICGKDNVCKNENTRCGKNCDDCTSRDQVCDIVQGTCVSCEPGNGFESEFNKCLSAEARNCGGVDCTSTISHWASNSLKCEESQCIVSECEVGYHPSDKGDNCVEDTDTECGQDRTNCSVLEFAHTETVGCVEGKCVATQCKNGDSVKPVIWDNAYELKFAPDDDTGTLPNTHIIGWFRHVYQLNNGVCTEINKNGFCGNSHLNCTLENKECVWELPALRCIGRQAATGCEEQDAAEADDYCVLNYSCKCPAGKHPSESQVGCDDDKITECGGEGDAYNCHKKCREEIEHCTSVSGCNNGLCVFSCEEGYNACIPNQTCLVKEGSGVQAVCSPKFDNVSTLDCGGGADIK